MNILIVGRGWVGRKMFDQLVINGHTVTLCPHQSAKETIRNSNFHWVVNCAGVTGNPNVDACENDKLSTIRGNAIFPIDLYDVCHQEGMRFAHFSSGCIYEGNIDDVYADPNFFGSTYSISKGIADSILKEKCLMFRVRLPFDSSNNRKNLLQKLFSYSISGKLVEGGLNSISDIDEAIEIAAKLMEQDAEGPYNLVNHGAVTTHEISDMLELVSDWYLPEEFTNATKAKRSNCVIPAYNKMSPVRDALTKRIREFKRIL